MREGNVEKRVLEIVQEVLNKQQLPASIDYDAKILSYADLSSLEAIEIIAYIEDEFQIEIEDELLGMEFISSISEMSEIVLKYLDKEM